MPEITEADRAAAEALWAKECNSSAYSECYAQAFAAHREATEAAIVAWLRKRDYAHGHRREMNIIADAIEAGAHRSDADV